MAPTSLAFFSENFSTYTETVTFLDNSAVPFLLGVPPSRPPPPPLDAPCPWGNSGRMSALGPATMKQKIGT